MIETQILMCFDEQRTTMPSFIPRNCGEAERPAETVRYSMSCWAHSWGRGTPKRTIDTIEVRS